MSRRPLQATLIGPSQAPTALLSAAEAIGAALAQRGITLVTGGRGGVMEAASRGAALSGGLVVGVLPGSELAQANRWCSVVLPTDLGHARNALTVLAGDLVICIGGAAGTLSEICFAWLQGRPILGLRGHGGWTDALAGQALDHRPQAPLQSCDSLDELLDALDSICDELERSRLPPEEH